jgi:hypothetical protein
MHTPQDTVAVLNLDYLLEQMKATTAIAAHLAVPLALEKKVHLPVIVKGY